MNEYFCLKLFRTKAQTIFKNEVKIEKGIHSEMKLKFEKGIKKKVLKIEKVKIEVKMKLKFEKGI